MQHFSEGDVLQRDLDGVWFDCVVLRKHLAGELWTYDVRYTDDGNVEDGVDPDELRVPAPKIQKKEAETKEGHNDKVEVEEGRDQTIVSAANGQQRQSGAADSAKDQREPETTAKEERPFEEETITEMVRRLVRETKAFEDKSERLRKDAESLVEQKQQAEAEIVALSKYQNSLQLMHMASELASAGLRMEAASESEIQRESGPPKKERRGEERGGEERRRQPTSTCVSRPNAPPTEMFAKSIEMSKDNEVALYKLGALFAGADALDEKLATNMVRKYLTAAKTISETPVLYVRELFDQYADTFDAELVGKLAYNAPKRIAEDVIPLAFTRLARKCGLEEGDKAASKGPILSILDLGCGTGLCGAHLRDCYGDDLSIFGCDISSKMVDIANGRGCYEDVVVSDAVSFLDRPFRTNSNSAAEAASSTTFDLSGRKAAAAGARTSSAPKCVDAVIAADVFPYVGDATAIFAAVARRLVPGGVFIFTTEGLYEEDASDYGDSGGGGGGGVGPGIPDFMLRTTERFAHSRKYLARLCEDNGFLIELEQKIVLRMDDGEPINGDIVLCRCVVVCG